jgi:nicotinate dehydrogenase subunit B
MTGLLHEREFSRKTFVKGGGALIVGFSLAGAGLAGKAQAAVTPDPGQVDSWVIINADNTATILSGKVELGQGSSTGLLQIAGEELDMGMRQLKFGRHETGYTPNTGTTSASLSIRQGGPQVRAACVEARKALLAMASTKLGVAVGGLSVAAGVVSGGGKSVTYGDLIGGKQFNITLPASYTMSQATSAGFTFAGGPRVGLIPGDPGTKPASQYKLVGTRVPRIEIPDIVSGVHTYLHNVRLPGMLHGRIVRPRGQGAWGTGAPIISVDENSIKSIANVQIVRKGDFLGVVAPKEYDAIQAAAQLKVKWQDSPVLPSAGGLFAQMRKHDSAGLAPATLSVNTGNVDAAFASAAQKVSASFSYPYNSHAPIGPTCAVADVKPGSAVVLSNTENAYGLRTKVATALGLPESAVRVQWWEGSSGYGDDAPYDDAGVSAALMSQLTGNPVRLQFMRWDEFGWDGYPPAQLSDIRAGIDTKGNIVAFDYTAFVIPYSDSSVPAASELIGIKPAPKATAAVYDTSRAGAQYNLPNRRLIFKSLPSWKATYFNVGFMRAPDSPQAPFAAEQVIDELAYAAKMDPVAFRLQNVTQSEPNKTRWSNLVNAVTQAAGWQPKVAGSSRAQGDVVSGRGFAMMDRSSVTIGSFANTIGASVADIEVNKKTGKIVVKHLYVGMDAGMSVNPGLVENQIVGGTIQTVSRALYEQVNFDKSHVTSLDWVSYPVLRFKDSPQVTPIVVQHMDLPPLGVGQEMVQTIAPAIANAFFDATGVRLRSAPMSPPRVRAALKAAGVA